VAPDVRQAPADAGSDGDAQVQDSAVDDTFDPEADRPDALGEVAPREEDDPVATQCNQIIDRAWAAMKPALKRLKVRASQRVEDDYRGMRSRNSSWTADESKSFLQRCRALPQRKRDCIAGAKVPVEGLYRCNVLFSGKRNLRPYPPTVYDHVKLVRPALVPREERGAMLAALAGTWVNDNPVDGYERTWVVDAEGKGRESIIYDGGKTRKVGFQLKVKRQLRLVRRDKGRRLPDLLTFWQEDATTMYASLSGYGVFAVEDPTRFVVDHFGEFVFWEGPRDGTERACEVVSATGLITRGRCSNNGRALTASWRFPEQRRRDGRPRAVQARWEWKGKHLLDQRLVQRERFVKRP